MKMLPCKFGCQKTGMAWQCKAQKNLFIERQRGQKHRQFAPLQ
ncbi:hypothetical protein N473_17980 [Pseudoalteromonas luteoviolacea CPMOR-1]|uniref:Uncharacterized protein n=1 Tax=Pseudoalteromonas luteoviolacea CPMOR-1 TaxID=1365248 RepID=A0A167KHF1_9GAMM|nr:hypothetical protein N473_17980 [Pseudoalteromonas luteoviolacea CPMOR-1]